ncbi:hypothetical protein Cgig2_009492 [Carnegiea gigantea]|uniref:Uncharacterized protein n=1 Tax=Carnegiea gigantea TaxID=171969 RepID=A0A9Q1GVP9_9CARY|nr:hypothetical protein Cgig2_009492 [Carnegiea gigantea]
MAFVKEEDHRVNMTCHSKSQCVEFSENHFKEEFIEDVRRDILGLVNLYQAILKAKALKEDDNKLFIIKAHRLAINTYDKFLQHLCVFVPKNVDDANVMEELGIFINLNLVACWLKINYFESVKQHCDLVMQLDLFNVKARLRRDQALLNMGLRGEARQDLLVAVRFDPNNEEIRKELSRVEEIKNARFGCDKSYKSVSQARGRNTFDPLKLNATRVPTSSSSSGVSSKPTNHIEVVRKIHNCSSMEVDTSN